MKCLLDTCSLLWMAEGNAKLSPTAREIIGGSGNECSVSVVSFWELSMKSVVGKLPLPLNPAQLGHLAEQEGISILLLTIDHVDCFHALPTGHRDAFDRLLAAVALTEKLSFISPDSELDQLGISRIW